ncbi:MAG: MFS transporter [Methanobacteriota archaeon]|nr:MAG: MFS transporter [Euryarchaeota archaeon]
MLKDSRSCTITTPLESCKIKKVLGQEHKECYHISTPESVTLNQILHLKDIPFLLLLYFLIFLAFNIFYVAFPVHAVESLQWSLLDLGIFFSSLGMIMVVVQGPLLAKISRKFSDGILTVVGSILLAFSFFCFTSREITIIYFAVALFSTGNGLMWPSFLSILSRVGGSRFQGAIQGYASSMGSLASIIGLITGGYLYGMLGIKTFYLPGLLILIIFALSIRLQKLQTPTQAD